MGIAGEQSETTMLGRLSMGGFLDMVDLLFPVTEAGTLSASATSPWADLILKNLSLFLIGERTRRLGGSLTLVWLAFESGRNLVLGLSATQV